MARSKTDVVSEYRRAQIVDAARKRFLAGGLKGTTISQIAQAAGVAKGTVYLYFRSKDAVLHTILEGDLKRLRDATIPAIRLDAPVDARVAAYLEAMVDFYEARKDFIELCQVELSRDLRKKARRQLGQVFAAQEAAWRDVIVGLGFKRADAVGRARAIVSLGYGLAVQRMRGWLDGPVARESEAAARLVWEGVAPR